MNKNVYLAISPREEQKLLCRRLISSEKYRDKHNIVIMCGRRTGDGGLPCKIKVNNLGDACGTHSGKIPLVPKNKPYYSLRHKYLNAIFFYDHSKRYSTEEYSELHSEWNSFCTIM